MPPEVKHCQISFPHPGVMLVLINRPKQLNCLSVEANLELDLVFRWFDEEPSLRVAIISGVGKTLCVGSDIKEWMSNNQKGIPYKCPENGFGGISWRSGKKPIIAAVNGPAYGGGCEIVLNCDLVVAAQTATFALPEVELGIAPMGGSLPQLTRIIGRQRAAEFALTGRAATAEEFESYGICNFVVRDGSDVVDKALEYAKMIAGNSPDAVIIVRQGLELGWDSLGVVGATNVFLEDWFRRLSEVENVDEGLKAFAEKREPRWKDSKL